MQELAGLFVPVLISTTLPYSLTACLVSSSLLYLCSSAIIAAFIISALPASLNSCPESVCFSLSRNLCTSVSALSIQSDVSFTLNVCPVSLPSSGIFMSPSVLYPLPPYTC